jgi:4-amino-4-deoxy-L-arabinose transferase-like glycosyltransferase
LPQFRSRFWITLAVCAIAYLPSLFWSFGLDQNIFAEIGSLLLRGARPYVDVWDVKPPNIFYTYTLFEWLFGQHEFAIRLSDYIASIAACAAMYLFVRRITLLEWASEIASVLLALTFLSLGLSDTAQTESYSLVFIISAAAIVLGTAGNSKYLVAGALIGIATFYKTTNAIFLLPLMLEGVVQRGKWWRASTFIVAGFILWCAIQIGLLAIEGSLPEYWRISWSVFTHHPQEASQLTFTDIVHAVWTYLDIWILLIPVGMIVALWKRDQLFFRMLGLPLLLFVVALIAVILQNKGWGYQYVIVLPGLISLAAISAAYLLKRLCATRKLYAIAVAAIVVCVTLSVSPSAHRRIHYTKDAFRNRDQYIQSLGRPRSLYYPVCTMQLSEYLQTHSKPEDEIFIFGEEPGAYWRSGRKSASRFIYALLFTSGVIPSEDLTAMQEALAVKKPSLVVLERFDTLNFRKRPETSESLLRGDVLFLPLKNLLAEYYSPADTVCENFLIYRRK